MTKIVSISIPSHGLRFTKRSKPTQDSPGLEALCRYWQLCRVFEEDPLNRPADMPSKLLPDPYPLTEEQDALFHQADDFCEEEIARETVVEVEVDTGRSFRFGGFPSPHAMKKGPRTFSYRAAILWPVGTLARVFDFECRTGLRVAGQINFFGVVDEYERLQRIIAEHPERYNGKTAAEYIVARHPSWFEDRPDVAQGDEGGESRGENRDKSRNLPRGFYKKPGARDIMERTWQKHSGQDFKAMAREAVPALRSEYPELAQAITEAKIVDQYKKHWPLGE